MKFCAAAALTAALIALFFQAHATAQTRTVTEAQINTYVTGIDRYIKRNPRLIKMYGDTADYEDSESKPAWREFKTKAAFQKATLYESAVVWTRTGKVVRAQLALTSPSGDWMHYIDYYFRDDGSVAKIQAQLNTFYGDVSVVRNLYFNGAGVQISSTRKYLDLKTQKPRKKPDEFFDNPVPVYKNLTDLPFYKLL